MLNHLIHAWRWVFSFLAYFLYGLFGIIGAVVFFIPFLILPKKITKKIAQFLIHFSYLALTKFLVITGVMAIKIENRNQLKDLKGTLIIANHPSFLDIVVLGSILPKADCIVKSSLWSNPFVGSMVRASQYIVSDNPLQLVDTCIERLNAGNNVMIFPEGTRSNPESLKDFKRGFASIAINSDCPVLPVFLTCTPPALTKKSPWYSIPSKRFVFHVNIFPPISKKNFTNKNNDTAMTSNELSSKFENFFLSLMNANEENIQPIFHQYFTEKT